LLKGEPMVPTFIGGASSEDEWRARFCAAGVPVLEPPVKDVEVGIDALYELIANDRLIVLDNLQGLLDELGSYSRELDDAGQPTEKIDHKEMYHRLDACRYLAVWLKRGGLANWQPTRDPNPGFVASMPPGVFSTDSANQPDDDPYDDRRTGRGD